MRVEVLRFRCTFGPEPEPEEFDVRVWETAKHSAVSSVITGPQSATWISDTSVTAQLVDGGKVE